MEIASQMRALSIRLVRSFDEARVKVFLRPPFRLAKKVLETWGRLS